MTNRTQFSFFVLYVYLDLDHFVYFCFIFTMLLYILILCTNIFLIVVISVNRSLHEPMYLFACSLFVNELLGSTGLFPFLLDQILRDLHIVPTSLCFLQIYCIYTYANVQFCNLAVMSYDRYLAICFPLQYHIHMTSKKVALLITTVWLYPLVAVLILVSLSSSLRKCGNIIHKVYCDNYSIVKLSCSDTMLNNVYGLFYTSVTIAVVLLIFYSYMRILKVCFSGSKLTRHKAVTTCTPHLATLMNFSAGCFFEILQNRFDMTHVPSILRIISSVYFFTCPPLFNPVVYGLSIRKIRIKCKSVFIGKK